MRPLDDWPLPKGLEDGTPLVAARCFADGRIETMASGHWPGGRAVALSDRFYVASLAKQVMGVALALLVRDGVIDPDRAIGDYLGGLPSWSSGATVRQVVHHVAALPSAGELESKVSGDWTDAAALAELERAIPPDTAPGARFSYSNIGYILLAQLIAKVSGVSFSAFVARQVLEPLGLGEIGFAPGDPPSPQWDMMGAMRPLSHGDGGIWSSARGFAQWLQLQNADALGTAQLVQAPGVLTDGTSVPYGWGIGLRAYRGGALYIHGGEWPGCTAKAVRSPSLGVGVVAMAAGAPIELVNDLISALLDDC